jgi:hypothetical protein
MYQQNLHRPGDPVWIPSQTALYYPDVLCPKKYKINDKPICAWFIEAINDKWCKIMYENIYWSVEKYDVYPYPQEQ